MCKIRRVAVALFTVIMSLIVVPVAFAHPLGNFTINHYTGLHVGRDKITLDFVLDMAEIPTFQEIQSFDSNGNGQPDPQETAKYKPARCATIGSQLDLRLNGRPLALRLDSSSIAFPPGAGGLSTLRLTCEFSAATGDPTQKAQLDFADNSYAARIGWREIVVTADGVSLAGHYATTSISQRLSAYPKDMLTDPLNERQIGLMVDPAGSTSAAQPANNTPSTLQPVGVLVNRNNQFTQLITLKDITPLTLLFALLVSFVWGGLHALTPGHGKTIVGAYLVGSRGTARHAFYLGLTTTITHTAGVIALGLITFAAARYIVPEQLFPWLTTLSGVLVAAIGLKMFVDRMRSGQLLPQLQGMRHQHTHDDAGLYHDHDDHGHGHSHAEDRDHVLHHRHVPDSHSHTHDEHGEHTHDHAHSPHAHPHTHLPPGAEGEPITWRSLLALGVSGGILPCPDALIVLLSAVALGRVAFGLVLVLAFSMGLAAALSGVGLLFVYAGRLFQLSSKPGKLLRLLPAASALVIAAAGVGITVAALSQMGLNL